jgi:hypothetical protein
MGGIAAVVGGLLYAVATLREANKRMSNPSKALHSAA